MKTKTLGARLKALDQAEGTFEALVAIFNNVDLVGDRILPGAFTGSLRKWQQRGRPIPIVFSHMWSDLDAHIGEVLEARETSEGLFVKGQLDMEDQSAAKVWRLMQRGTLAEFSFAYEIIEEKRQNGANELIELEIIEIGPTLKGANPATQLLGVKAGARNSAADRATMQDLRDHLSAAVDLLDELMHSAEPKQRSSTPTPSAYAVRIAAELLEMGVDLPDPEPKRSSGHSSALGMRIAAELLALS